MLNEADFQRQIVELAELFGWRVMHVHPLRTKDGWRTPTSHVGWPDLTLWRPPHLICWEVKTDRGRLTDMQARTLDELAACGITAAVVRPKDWETIEATLRGRTR